MLKRIKISILFAVTVFFSCKKSADNTAKVETKTPVLIDTIKTFGVHNINLSSDISFPENQYSGLDISKDSLYLLSECRLQDNLPAFLDRAALKDLQTAIGNPSYVTAFERIKITGLDKIRNIINGRRQIYEGLEAMVINKSEFYFSIETTNSSDSCYIIKGKITNNVIDIDASNFLGIPKPKNANGQNIDNAGFESLEKIGDRLHAFFEYNYFSGENRAVSMDLNLNHNSLAFTQISKVPYRLTDVSYDPENDQLFGLNYFFRGDAAYRLNSNDIHYSAIFNNGVYQSFNQIITLQNSSKGFQSKVIGVLPVSFWGFNFEGLAKYENGFFMINDKFTPTSGRNFTSLTYFSY